MNMPCRLCCIMLCALLPLGTKLSAQGLRNWTPRAGITLGYTLGGRMRYGFDAQLLHGKNSPEQQTGAWGFGVSKYWAGIRYGYRKDIHRLHSFYALRQEGMFTLKAGPGFVRNPWGYGNNVYCRTGGLFLAAEGMKPEYRPLMAGADILLYMRSTWRWYDAPYTTIYSGAGFSF